MEQITGTRCETLHVQTGHMAAFVLRGNPFRQAAFSSFTVSFCAVYPHAFSLKNHCLFDMWHHFFLALLSLPSVHLCEMAVELIASY